MKKVNKLTKYIVLVVVCVIVPAAVVWDFLPSVLADYPKLLEAINRLTGIYLTIMVTGLIVSFANTFRRLGEQHALPHQQYVNSFISVLKIILYFIAVIIIVAIILDKDPSTLLAGLGAMSLRPEARCRQGRLSGEDQGHSCGRSRRARVL